MTSQSSCVSTTSSCVTSSLPAASRCATSSCRPSPATCASPTPSLLTSRWTSCQRSTRAPDLYLSLRTCCLLTSGMPPPATTVSTVPDATVPGATLSRSNRIRSSSRQVGTCCCRSLPSIHELLCMATVVLHDTTLMPNTLHACCYLLSPFNISTGVPIGSQQEVSSCTYASCTLHLQEWSSCVLF